MLRLLFKISKTRGIVPTSYILPLELVRVGTVRCGGGFGDVSDGEYSGRSVAIKRLRTSEVNSNRAFKVPLINLVRHRRSSYPVFMSRGHRLETLVPSKHLASVGRFCVCRLALPLHRH